MFAKTLIAASFAAMIAAPTAADARNRHGGYSNNHYGNRHQGNNQYGNRHYGGGYQGGYYGGRSNRYARGYYGGGYYGGGYYGGGYYGGGYARYGGVYAPYGYGYYGGYPPYAGAYYGYGGYGYPPYAAPLRQRLYGGGRPRYYGHGHTGGGSGAMSAHRGPVSSGGQPRHDNHLNGSYKAMAAPSAQSSAVSSARWSVTRLPEGAASS